MWQEIGFGDDIFEMDGAGRIVEAERRRALYDKCPGCERDYPLGYLTPDELCDECRDDIDAIEEDDE